MRADTRNKYSQYIQILESSENRLDSLQCGGQIVITQIPEEKYGNLNSLQNYFNSISFSPKISIGKISWPTDTG